MDSQIQQRINELNKMITDANIKMSDFINGITSTTYGASYEQIFEWERERKTLERINELNKMIADANIKMSDFINGITNITYGASYEQIFEWEKERNALIK